MPDPLDEPPSTEQRNDQKLSRTELEEWWAARQPKPALSVRETLLRWRTFPDQDVRGDLVRARHSWVDPSEDVDELIRVARVEFDVTLD